MKVVTWNVNSVRTRLEGLVRWLELAQPDVVCLQETKTTDGQFPSEAIAEAGWVHQNHAGQKTYNGVALLSRHPIDDVHVGFATGEADPQKRLITGVVKGVRLVNCYVPNGNKVGSQKFAYKLDWLRRLREHLDSIAVSTEPTVVLGDFNIAPGDLDVWDPFGFDGNLLCHPAERAALAHIKSWGLTDAYRAVQPMGTAYTWWDYRGMGYRRNQGLRIDLILLSEVLAKKTPKVKIWRDLRGWDTPSDHVPVEVTLDIP